MISERRRFLVSSDTYAARKYDDDVPEETKKRRLSEIIDLQRGINKEKNEAEVGRTVTALVEGPSKKSDAQLAGRADNNKMVVFDREDYERGDYVRVRVTDCTSATLLGEPLEKVAGSQVAG